MIERINISDDRFAYRFKKFKNLRFRWVQPKHHSETCTTWSWFSSLSIWDHEDGTIYQIQYFGIQVGWVIKN